MPNPWLSMPLADYEGHMSSPAVQQLDALSDLFAEALTLHNPASVAILGIAGGNGLERIDPSLVQRVVGVDVNHEYLDTVRQRYAQLPCLELHCIDLAEQALELRPVQLVHAALIFEHAGTDQALESAIFLVAPGGALSVVLQLPSDAGPNIGCSGFAKAQQLGGHFALVDPGWLTATLQARGFTPAHPTIRPVPAGKRLWMSVFTSA
jgi:hypothetical protein